MKRFVASRKGLWQKRLPYIGILSIMLLALLVFATCGDDDPEEIPDRATSVAVAPTPEAPDTTLRPRNEWTEANPATRAEIEAELGKYRGKSISVLDGGGAWQAAHRNAYYIPFQEEFGIEIVEDTTSSIVGQIRGMSETGNITVDIGVWGIDVAIQLGRSGHAAELDYSVIDLRDHFPDLVEAGKPYIAGGGDIFSTVVAYSTESFPDSGPQPSTMADFFDLEEFPGKRGMWSFWQINPHLAYIAQHPEVFENPGALASLSSLTDAQMEEAWTYLDDFVSRAGSDFITWDSGSDCPALLIAGELDLCTTWNGRIYDAVVAEDAPINICWECGHVMDADYYFVPNGLKELDAERWEMAQLFLAWMSFPDVNARESLYIPYGPVNQKALPLLADSAWDHIRDALPTAPDNAQYGLFLDSSWAGATADAAQERWSSILLRQEQPEAPDTTLRPRNEWTEANPATRAEIEAELGKYRGKSISVLDGGGAWQAAHRNAYYIPFQEEFGIEIVEDTTSSIVGQIRGMSETGNITVDIGVWGIDVAIQLGRSGHAAELDYSVIDLRDHFPDLVEAGKPYIAGGGDIFSTVVAYSTESFPDSGPQPSTMADFFDLEEFPGKRGMWSFWQINPHLAYIAQHPEVFENPGALASLSSLTDAQMEEAWTYLDDFVSRAGSDFITWDSGSDCPALLIAGELDLCTTWNGRIYDAVVAEDAPINICWECGHVMDADYYFVPNGLKELDAERWEMAQLFLAWMSFPDVNARESLYIPYGPVNQKALPLLADSAWDHIRDALPTAPDNAQYGLFLDSSWAGATADAAQERWSSILQTR